MPTPIKARCLDIPSDMNVIPIARNAIPTGFFDLTFTSQVVSLHLTPRSTQYRQ
jgi:hypothetical protein